MKHPKIYTAIMLICFFGTAVFLNLAGREGYSEVERRELAGFPELSAQSYVSGEYFRGITAWFSDTVPMRDKLTTAALAAEELKGIRLKSGEEEISFHGVMAVNDDDDTGQEQTAAVNDKPDITAVPAANPVSQDKAVSDDSLQAAEPSVSSDTVSEDDIPEPEQQTASLPAHTNSAISDNVAAPSDDFTSAANGIIVTGDGENTRAIMMYGGSTGVTTQYAQVANKYKELMPELNVYVMVIPTSVSYYCPQAALAYTGSQLKQINNVQANLNEDVIGIDVYTILGEHRDEPIYLRTDHHWAPLGAYYAASKLAEAAGLDYLDISEYDVNVVHNYVGSMYAYAKDIRISSNPEDFVYYVPKNVELKTTYTNYKLDSSWNVVGEAEPAAGQFFIKYPDGSGGAYCTFMGGDAKITRVETSVKNGRRLLILKDSYGNALPAFLFGSFEEVHVIDSRYFTKNIVEYISEYQITDLLFANNAFHASTGATVRAYERYLTQGAE